MVSNDVVVDRKHLFHWFRMKKIDFWSFLEKQFWKWRFLVKKWSKMTPKNMKKPKIQRKRTDTIIADMFLDLLQLYSVYSIHWVQALQAFSGIWDFMKKHEHWPIYKRFPHLWKKISVFLRFFTFCSESFRKHVETIFKRFGHRKGRWGYQTRRKCTFAYQIGKQGQFESTLSCVLFTVILVKN